VGHGHLNDVTLGLHWKGKLPSGFDYDNEFDGQKGSLGKYSIGAWAGYASLGKTFRKAPASPRTFLELNYASGTKNPAGRDWNTFDQLYPSNHDKYGFAGILCSTEPALKKYPLRNGDSNSNSQGSGWPQRMTISITGPARLPFTRIPARAGTSATNSTSSLNTH
jgi:hypothetical protein